MITKERIPPNILIDVQKPDTILEIAPNWSIQEAQDKIWLYNESAGAISFSRDSMEAKILDAVQSRKTCVREVAQANLAATKVLLDLWCSNIIRLNSSDELDERDRSNPSRYIWFEEYLRRYASPSLPVSKMFADLACAKVCIIGLGGVGSTLALSLAASGVGALRLVDGDKIEESNLPRQILYAESTLGQDKSLALKSAILRNNSQTAVDAHVGYISSLDDARDAVGGCDFVALCADQPRFLIRNWVGKACFEKHIPHISMAGQWVGPISVPGLSPCHACIGRFHGARVADTTGYIESLNGASVPPRASFGPRPLILSGFFSSAIIHFLVGIDRESLLHRRFKFDVLGGMEEETLVQYRNCVVCGHR
ncbi:HesA/MoeB/ThiF family protein [Cupriavidus gilardii]|uniref:HesA/MoeB/ThiF family protein n=1 Tax=Cupriavidus gilardii TaxID=82541 RepID=UPI0009EED89A|nr:ThiF family adenylyltransferase [Cupriavidus gilardii]